MEKSALILIEFQKEWLDSNGKLNGLMQDRNQFSFATKAGREALSIARAANMPIAHCGLRFQPGYPELGGGCFATTGLTNIIPKVGTFAIDGTGSQFDTDFTPLDGEFIVYGRTGASGFSGSNLDIWLRNNRISRVYLAGFALHVCIESTFRAGHDLGYQMVILEDACSAFTAEQKRYVLDDVVHHFGERMTNNNFSTAVSCNSK